MELELFFDTSKYVKISNPSFSIGGDIVLRGKTIDGEIKHIVAFDNSIYKLPKEKLQPIPTKRQAVAVSKRNQTKQPHPTRSQYI